MKFFTKQNIIKLSIITVLIAVMITFTALVYSYNKDALPIDAVIRDFAYQIRGQKGGVIYWITRIVTELGDYTGVFIVVILVGIFTKFDERFVMVALAALLMHFANSTLKHIVLRPRPIEEFRWQYEGSTSFPSGHSATAGVLYTTSLIYILNSNLSKKIKLAAKIVLPLTILVVMTTRIILGVHYFSDVVTGASFGAIIAIFCSFFLPLAEKVYDWVMGKLKKLIKIEKKETNN